MFRNLLKALSARTLAPAYAAASLLALASLALAQSPAQTTPPQQQMPPVEAARADAADAKTVASAAAPAAPLYGEYRGVRLGMTAEEARAKLGRPAEKSDAMDFFVFSDTERARVYYQDGKASAVIATYIGRDAKAPAAAAVLGEEIEARPDGSMYKMTAYPQAGYWVAYSRTAGDAPMVIITMQKTR